MLHDVVVEIWNPARAGVDRATVQVDADNGDDAVERAGVKASLMAEGRGFRIVGVAPAAQPMADAGVEGDDEPVEPAPKRKGG